MGSKVRLYNSTSFCASIKSSSGKRLKGAWLGLLTGLFAECAKNQEILPVCYRSMQQSKWTLNTVIWQFYLFVLGTSGKRVKGVWIQVNHHEIYLIWHDFKNLPVLCRDNDSKDGFLLYGQILPHLWDHNDNKCDDRYAANLHREVLGVSLMCKDASNGCVKWWSLPTLVIDTFILVSVKNDWKSPSCWRSATRLVITWWFIMRTLKWVGSVPIVDKKASKPGKFAMIDENDAPGASFFESYDSSLILSCSL